MQTPDWVEALSDPAAYPFAVQRVERRETHISWLFFAGERVYKAKKPVNFGFVDYSTLARREHFCHEELRLNRRLAGDTHLGVVAIRRRPDGRIGLDGDGETLDYAVAMRRLPAERMLDALRAELTAKGLAAGEKIVVDASFARADWRAPFCRLATDAGVPALLLGLTAPEDAVRRRLEARQRAGQDSSQADYAVYRAAREDFQPPGEWPADQRATLTSPVNAVALADTVIDRLIARGAGREPAA